MRVVKGFGGLGFSGGSGILGFRVFGVQGFCGLGLWCVGAVGGCRAEGCGVRGLGVKGFWGIGFGV